MRKAREEGSHNVRVLHGGAEQGFPEGVHLLSKFPFVRDHLDRNAAAPPPALIHLPKGPARTTPQSWDCIAICEHLVTVGLSQFGVCRGFKNSSPAGQAIQGKPVQIITAKEGQISRIECSQMQ